MIENPNQREPQREMGTGAAGYADLGREEGDELLPSGRTPSAKEQLDAHLRIVEAQKASERQPDDARLLVKEGEFAIVTHRYQGRTDIDQILFPNQHIKEGLERSGNSESVVVIKVVRLQPGETLQADGRRRGRGTMMKDGTITLTNVDGELYKNGKKVTPHRKRGLPNKPAIGSDKPPAGFG